MSYSIDQLGRLPIGALLTIVCALIVTGLAVWSAPRIARMIKDRPAPAPVAKPFLTNRKHAMLAALERVLPMYRIHAQVAVGAVLAPGARPGRRQRPSDSEAFSRKIVDFVIVDPTSSAIVALIEMGERFADPEADRDRDAMMARAGYQTIRISWSDRATVATAQAAVGHLRDSAFEATPVVARLPMPVWPLEGRFNGAR